ADDDAVALGPEPVGVGPGHGAGDPLAGAVRSRGAPVEGGGQLQHDVGPAGAAVVQVGGELALDGLGSAADVDRDPRLAEAFDPGAPDAWVGIEHGDDHPRDAGVDHRIDA